MRSLLNYLKYLSLLVERFEVYNYATLGRWDNRKEYYYNNKKKGILLSRAKSLRLMALNIRLRKANLCRRWSTYKSSLKGESRSPIKSSHFLIKTTKEKK